MVATAEHVALQPWEITAKNGDHFELVVGKTYTTTKYIHDGELVVFSRYWVHVPAECFMGAEEQRANRLQAAIDRLSRASAKLKRANAEIDAAEREQREARNELLALDRTAESEEAKHGD